MASKITNDPRIDPRLKKLFGEIAEEARAGDVASREQLLAEERTDAAKARIAMLEAMFAMCDNEQVAPSKGLKITTETFRSEPDGNIIKIQYIRPDTDERAAVRLLHPRRGHAVLCPASTACTERGVA